MNTIKVPGVGPVKGQYVIAGGAVVVVIVGVTWYRHRNASAAAAAASPVNATATPVDSGYTAVDTSGAGYGGGGTYPSGGGYPYPNSYNGYCPYGQDVYGNCLPAPTSTPSTTGGVYTTNNDWATAAETALENAGVGLSVSTMAISRVLGGLSVTPPQKDIFLQAIGLLGQPPQGYPQPIKLTETPSAGPGTPSVTPAAPKNLKVTKVYTHSVNLDWDNVTGAKGYRVFMNGKQLVTVTYSSFAPQGLAARSHYTFYVEAVGATDKLSAKSNTVSVTTNK